jgi:ribosome biogenesis protein ERB1
MARSKAASTATKRKRAVEDVIEDDSDAAATAPEKSNNILGSGLPDPESSNEEDIPGIVEDDSVDEEDEDDEDVTGDEDEDDEEEFTPDEEEDESEDDSESDQDDPDDFVHGTEAIVPFPVAKKIVSDITGRPKRVYPDIEPDYDSDSSTEEVRTCSSVLHCALVAHM